MRSLSFLLLFAIFSTGAWSADWKRWPGNADEFSTTIGHPPGFLTPRWQPSSDLRPKHKAPHLISALFRSPDGKAEFMAVAYYVRHGPADPAARRIPTPLARGEKITREKSASRKIAGENGPYRIYEEETIVEGPGYTSYRLNTFSTSSLPGAASVYWSFKVADESARKRYAPLWRQFKDSLEIESD